MSDTDDEVMLDEQIDEQVDEVIDEQESQEPDAEEVEEKHDYQKIIIAKAAEAREAKRRAKEAEERLRELEAQTNPSSAPEVPPVPDEYDFDTDEEYRGALKKRDDALLAKARFDAQESYKQQQEEQQFLERSRKQQEELQSVVKSYSERAGKLGVSAEDLQAAGSIVGQYGLSDHLTKTILHLPDGPLVTKYLSDNIHELDALSSMSPEQATIHLVSQVSQKAAALKPKPSNAPPPPDELKGSGYTQDRDPLLQGVTFE